MKFIPQPRYKFVSIWRIQAPQSAVGQALLHYEDWTSWWQGLENVRVIHTKNPVSLRFICTWRSMLGYKLYTTITVSSHIPNTYIAFTSAGDLVGDGNFILHQHGAATTITIHWNVYTTKAWMNLLTPLLRPIFVYSHSRLMKQGETGLRQYLEQSRAP